MTNTEKTFENLKNEWYGISDTIKIKEIFFEHCALLVKAMFERGKTYDEVINDQNKIFLHFIDKLGDILE